VHERKEKEKNKSESVLALIQRENTREERANARLSRVVLEQSNSLENTKHIGVSRGEIYTAPVEQESPPKHLPP
jgi:hypothetical protein